MSPQNAQRGVLPILPSSDGNRLVKWKMISVKARSFPGRFLLLRNPYSKNKVDNAHCVKSKSETSTVTNFQ